MNGLIVHVIECNGDEMTVAYDDFELVSPLGGLFRYYISDCMCWREALNAHAEWTQPDGVKKLSKTVYDLAHRTAVKADE